MKKQLLSLGFATLSLLGVAQTARTVLYEEFTGENCGPCAATNPGLNTLLLANLSNVVPIKWQVDIPSAPTTTWSLFQTDKTEIQWRAYTYGYGVSSAPNGRIDGQSQTVFGAASDHPGYMTQSIINTATAVTSPFTLTMLRSWDPGFTTMTATISITAAQTFTCAGPLIFRLVMVEKAIHFASAPGSNGEKDFYYAARKSYPTIQSGTSLPTSWTLGQNQTFTIACVAPSYINSKPEVELVGFIQDDATKKVQQAGITKAPNDAQNLGVVSKFLNCNTTPTPAIAVSNVGVNTITTMTIQPVLDAVAGTPYAWSGSLPAGATTTIIMPSVSAAVGNHTYSTNITFVNGGNDDYMPNNNKNGSFAVSTTVTPAPIIEPFTTPAFPPTNWYKNNQDGGTYTFSKYPTIGAYQVPPLGCVKYDSWNNPVVGDRDELYMPTSDFTGLTNSKMTFDVAYAQADTTINDGLEVLVSTNCGVTWNTVYSKYGAVLASAPVATVAFIPTATQWRSEVVNLSAYDGMSSVLVKLVVNNDYGNNIWIDNINLVSSTDIKSFSASYSGIEVYPNPAQNEATVRITSSKPGESTVTMLNALGQAMLQQKVEIEMGGNDVRFDTKNLASGIYYMIIADKEGKSVTKKLTVTK